MLLNIDKKIDRSMNGSCAVLLYHRATQLESDPQLLSVSPQHFDEQLNYLKNNYRVLPIEEFSEILLSKKRFPAKSVVLTFDDGYADNYLEALPILEKHQLQALFYISTGTLNTSNEYWWDAVERIVLYGKQPSEKMMLEAGGVSFDLNGDRHLLYESLLPVLRRLPSETREQKIKHLAEVFHNNDGRPSHRAMRWDELKAMHQSASAVIGAHTHLHPSLGKLNVEEQEQEILRSKSILEQQLNCSIEHFSYPFGTKLDFTEDTIRICRKAGFKMVAANFPKFANRKSNPFAFPRHLVRDWNLEEFKRHLVTFF